MAVGSILSKTSKMPSKSFSKSAFACKVGAKLAKIDAVIETRGPDHVDEIISSLQASNFQVRQMEDSAS